MSRYVRQMSKPIASTHFCRTTGRPGVTAAAVDEHVAAIDFEQRENVPEQGDQVERERGVPGIEGRTVARPVEARLVHLVLQRDLGVLVVRTGIGRQSPDGRNEDSAACRS